MFTSFLTRKERKYLEKRQPIQIGFLPAKEGTQIDIPHLLQNQFKMDQLPQFKTRNTNLQKETQGIPLKILGQARTFKENSNISELTPSINIWDNTEIKCWVCFFLPAKKAISRANRQYTEWEKNLSLPASDKELTVRICKEFQKSNTKKIKIPINKWADELNSQFF